MSPEQARGRVAEIGPPTDVWAIGLIAYRLLTGKVYWQATTLAELMVQIITEPMTSPSQRIAGLPSAFDAWFARSTDRDPSKRFRTVGEQVNGLATALGIPAVPRAPVISSADGSGSFQVTAMPATQPASMLGGHTTANGLAASSVRGPAPRKRTPLPFVLASVIALAGIGGVVVFKMSRGPVDASPATATPGTEETHAKPRELKPTKTAEPEPDPTPTIAPAAVTPTAKPTTPAPTATGKAVAPKASTSSSAAAPVTAVVSPEPVKTADPKPTAVAAPPPPAPAPVDTGKKKYDPAAP
jgi:serine/threonine protein kinase